VLWPRLVRGRLSLDFAECWGASSTETPSLRSLTQIIAELISFHLSANPPAVSKPLWFAWRSDFAISD
jgi:hypothetical protein